MKLMNLEIVDISITDFNIEINPDSNHENNHEQVHKLNDTNSSDDECSSRTSHTTDENLLKDSTNNNNINDIDTNTDEFNKNLVEKSSSDYSSISKSNGSDSGSNSGSDSGSDTGSDSGSDTITEETLWTTIPKFPVQVICMEKCEDTLDSLIINNLINDDELTSAYMQIIMTLITYQQVFHMTHNDLHTNNIMYVSTNKKFLYYKCKNIYYKVPTYGKIYKIIDFGRAIYKFNGQIICSDSFKHDEDAGGQYNTEPFFNKNKPRLNPNFSFDLCRLGCSIFDYIVDELDEVKDLSKCEPNTRLIVEWCIDDNNNNILYKTNGDERYPDFKLYKMISRLVHNHTPIMQLDRPQFKQYIVKQKSISKDIVIMNIDDYPSLV
jgi:hypothetical protein